MVPQGNYYGTFDYGRAYGSNPFQESSALLSDMVKQMRNSAFQSSTGSSSGASSALSSSLSPDDPEVQNYMNHVLGGQRKTLDDYVAQAAGAGIKRGGLNVVGGPTLESSLHQAAMKNLAGGYADRFREAMNQVKSDRETQYSRYTDSINELQSMLGLQRSFLTSQADWQSRLGDTMHGDWRSDVDWNRETPGREIELENARRRLENERLHNIWEAADRGRTQQEQLQNETKWEQLAQKLPSGWNSTDSMWSERLGVLMGYLKPWDRSFSSKISGTTPQKS